MCDTVYENEMLHALCACQADILIHFRDLFWTKIVDVYGINVSMFLDSLDTNDLLAFFLGSTYPYTDQSALPTPIAILTEGAFYLLHTCRLIRGD